ncbi:hypothetical protein [Psychromonas ossibalaenae]|nr:hypothetical protein [Psychromonas ossibalaenae]
MLKRMKLTEDKKNKIIALMKKVDMKMAKKVFSYLLETYKSHKKKQKTS